MKRVNILLSIITLAGMLSLAFGQPAPAAAQPPNQGATDNGLEAVNSYRSQAGVAPVIADPILTAGCVLHTAYMVKNHAATQNEVYTSADYTAEGDLCARNALIYYLPENPEQVEAGQTVDAWLESPTHRMWLLYPTLAAVGYDYKASAVGEDWVTVTAMDVLSGIDFAADFQYPNWPARYPAPGQLNIPAAEIAISTWWPYAGPTPAVNLSNTTLTTTAGVAVPISVRHDPQTYGGHKHITLIPDAPLKDDTIYLVHLEGTYDGEYFNYEWKFSTGTIAIPN